MSKRIDINLHDCRMLKADEYPYIYLDHTITDGELNNAIDVITTYLMQNNLFTLYIDLDVRNERRMPTKEMTIGDIEKALGHKVKIVKDKKEKK